MNWYDEIREGQARGHHAQQGGLRKALLQRIADRLAYARELDGGSLEPGCWSCCWVSYEFPSPYVEGRIEGYIYPICDQDTCAHWHHQTEVFLA